VNAHAHNWTDDDFFGWICVADERYLFTPSGASTRVMWHEYAHLLVPDANHGRRWRAVIRQLGWPSEARRYGDLWPLEIVDPFRDRTRPTPSLIHLLLWADP